jgi:hypothetical protein
VFTARYELGLQIKRIQFRPKGVNLLVCTIFFEKEFASEETKHGGAPNKHQENWIQKQKSHLLCSSHQRQAM